MQRHHLAQGALVTGFPSALPPGAAEGCELAQGTRVGVIGPGGNVDVLVSVGGILDADGPPGPREVAQGAAVPL